MGGPIQNLFLSSLVLKRRIVTLEVKRSLMRIIPLLPPPVSGMAPNTIRCQLTGPRNRPVLLVLGLKTEYRDERVEVVGVGTED